ncbi:MAG: pro-sigmaK processing inhibitor BofA family protein [Clostridium sp.]
MFGILKGLNVNMVTYIVIMAVLLSIVISIRIKNSIIFKLGFRLVIAIGVIYGINYLSPYTGFDISIPLNPITAGVVAVLSAPGMALLYITKFALFPI